MITAYEKIGDKKNSLRERVQLVLVSQGNNNDYYRQPELLRTEYGEGFDELPNDLLKEE